MLARFARLLIAVALVGAAATGCVGTPGPTETTPTPLTDEQAFAAAEETYRAYVDALNQVDLSDPETFEPVYALTTGDLNSQDRRNFSEWQAETLTIEGDAQVAEVAPMTIDRRQGSLEVVLEACYDVSRVDVRTPDGASLVDSTRPPVQPLKIRTVTEPGRSPLITAIEPAAELTC
jgi:hypothetical protein